MRVFVFGFPLATAVLSTSAYAHKAWLGALAIMAVLTMVVGNAATVRITAARSSFSIVFDLRNA